MNDTRIKVEYVHDEKESDHGAISIKDRTPLQSKKKKSNLHLKFHRLQLSQRTADDTTLKHAHLVMVHFRGGEPLVASSAKNLLGDSTYLRLDLDETRPAELYSGYPADGRREARQQFFKSQQKPALSFAPRNNGAAQLQRKNSIDLWHIPSAKATENTLSRDVTASCIRCRKMRQKKSGP